MRLSLLSATLLATGIAHAATPVDGWYTKLFGGYSFIPDNVFTTVDGFFYDDPSFNGGFNAGGGMGYKSGPISYELEYSYLHANTQVFNIDEVRQTGVYGNTSASFFMANIYYTFPEMVPSVEPFLGLGIGYAHIDDRLGSTGPTGDTYFMQNDNLFAYQGTAGFTYNFSENYAATLTYRYSATEHSGNLGRVYQAHSASAGVIYRFAERSYK